MRHVTPEMLLPPPKKSKSRLMQTSMTTIFWNKEGVLLVDFLTRGSTVNATSYDVTIVKGNWVESTGTVFEKCQLVI